MCKNSTSEDKRNKNQSRQDSNLKNQLPAFNNITTSTSFHHSSDNFSFLKSDITDRPGSKRLHATANFLQCATPG